MSTSFFAKFTPPGSTPIAAQKRVVKTSHSSSSASTNTPSTASAASSDDARRQPRSTTNSAKKQLVHHHPRRIASAHSVEVTKRPRIPTPPRTSSTPALKRSLDSVRSTPNLKRPSATAPSSSSHSHRDSLKPPSPESLGGTSYPRYRSSASSRSPRSLRLESSSEEDDSEDERAQKRSKVGGGSASPAAGRLVNSSRRILHPVSFRLKDPVTGLVHKSCVFVHAHEIANRDLENWSRRKGTPHLTLSPPHAADI